MQPLATFTTELPPCCIQVNGELIVVGTYKLQEGTNRWGSLDIYRCDAFDEITRIENHVTKSAILDIKFNHDRLLLVLAHSEGYISLWRFETGGSPIMLSMKSIQVEEDRSVLVTLVQFNPVDANKVLVTLTSGYLAIVDLETSIISWLDTAHDLECWTGNFSETVGPVVYTGGDDSALIAHDLRSNQTIFHTNYSHHEAGVVGILSPSRSWNIGSPHQLWTGSYDDNVRILDLRVIDKELYSMPPTIKQKANLGGGVWRLIPKPQTNRVLTCCMYNGGSILDSSGGHIQVGRTFKGQHESMVYGADWMEDTKFVTCSFYDKIVHIWED